MKTSINLLLRFAVTYLTKAGTEATWNYTAVLYPSGALRVFDPAWNAKECKRAHYFQSNVTNSITNKGNRYISPYNVLCAFINIAVRECFFPFRDLHFGYDDPYVPKIEMTVKMDQDVYDVPIQFKAASDGSWICVDSGTKHLFVDAKGRHRSMRDEAN